MHQIIGIGSFGAVRIARHVDKGVTYALKKCRKHIIRQKGQEKSIQREKEILSENDYPFIVKLIKTFRDKRYLYFLTELIVGGELYDAIRILNLLDREQTQFYIGSLYLALDYLQGRHICYRDLKPENVLIDGEGYIKMVDFGCAVKLKGPVTLSMVGTPHYMAPEVLMGRGYNFSADVWSLGICFYEFMCGPVPFASECVDENLIIFKQILKSDLVFPLGFDDIPAARIMEKLLKKDPLERIGCGLTGLSEIRKEPFFNSFSFPDLCGRRIEAPIVPGVDALPPCVSDAEDEDDGTDEEDEFPWEHIFDDTLSGSSMNEHGAAGSNHGNEQGNDE